jgi:hypothetical protein
MPGAHLRVSNGYIEHVRPDSIVANVFQAVFLLSVEYVVACEYLAA